MLLGLGGCDGRCGGGNGLLLLLLLLLFLLLMIHIEVMRRNGGGSGIGEGGRHVQQETVSCRVAAVEYLLFMQMKWKNATAARSLLVGSQTDTQAIYLNNCCCCCRQRGIAFESAKREYGGWWPMRQMQEAFSNGCG